MSEILIDNGTVMTVNDQNEIYPSGYVHLIGDRIAEVGPGAPPDEINKNVTETIDAAGFMVMPGMTNAYVHLQQTLIRGLLDDRSLFPWFLEIAEPTYLHMTEAEIYPATLMGFVENIRGGATAVTDNFTVRPNPEGYNAVFKAAKDVAIRYKMARGYSDTGYPNALMESGDEVIASTQHLHEIWCSDDDLLSIDFSPNVVWSTTDKTLSNTAPCSAATAPLVSSCPLSH